MKTFPDLAKSGYINDETMKVRVSLPG
jgi:hypothetical protein